MKNNKPILVSCGIFKDEIEALEKRKLIDVEHVFLDSMLHMHPEKLRKKLDSVINENTPEKKVILLYGECHMYFDSYDNLPQVEKVDGKNCVEIILGAEKKKKLFKEGAFFLMPEWLEKWKIIFEKELRFSQDISKKLMSEAHKKLVYIDTGCIPVNMPEIRKMSEYLELPYEIEKVDLSILLKNIKDAIERSKKS